MTEFEFELSDRITKIKAINDKYNLLRNSYISFSGGKDSTVLSHLFDLALPGNNIPRVYINTGIEYKFVVDYVKELQHNDNRIIVINSGVNIRKMLDENGYPFKSKEHSEKLSYFQKSGMTKTVINYIGKGSKENYICPKKLLYQFTPGFNLKVSKKCCDILKKDVINKWALDNNKEITITGLRHDEGGLRQSIKGCTIFNDNKLKKFHPILPVTDNFINIYINTYKIKLCKLYYPPFNFTRTGCTGCPYAIDLQKELDLMAMYLPAERKKCEYIWYKVYNEYRKIGYRLDKEPNLFDMFLRGN